MKKSVYLTRSKGVLKMGNAHESRWILGGSKESWNVSLGIMVVKIKVK